MSSRSALPPVLAVVAVDEVGHGLVGAVDLVLHEPRLHAPAHVTLEQTEPPRAILETQLRLLHLPVRTHRAHHVVDSLLSEEGCLSAGKAPGIHGHHVMSTQLTIQDSLAELPIVLGVHQVEQETPRLVRIGLAPLEEGEEFVLKTQCHLSSPGSLMLSHSLVIGLLLNTTLLITNLI